MFRLFEYFQVYIVKLFIFKISLDNWNREVEASKTKKLEREIDVVIDLYANKTTEVNSSNKNK